MTKPVYQGARDPLGVTDMCANHDGRRFVKGALNKTGEALFEARRLSWGSSALCSP